MLADFMVDDVFDPSILVAFNAAEKYWLANALTLCLTGIWLTIILCIRGFMDCRSILSKSSSGKCSSLHRNDNVNSNGIAAQRYH